MNFSIFAEQIAVYDYLPVNRSGIWLHFVSYLDSIEQNLMALVLTKERLNEFIKSGEVKEQSDIFDEFNVSMSMIESLLIKTLDEKGNVRVTWGSQRIAA